MPYTKITQFVLFAFFSLPLLAGVWSLENYQTLHEEQGNYCIPTVFAAGSDNPEAFSDEGVALSMQKDLALNAEGDSIEFSAALDDEAYYISELNPDSDGGVFEESDFEGSSSDACPKDTPLPLYRDLRTFGILVFFGIFHLPGWNEISNKIDIVCKSNFSENRFWTAPKYVKTVSGLSP
jgi:hypothetical protein